VRTESLISKRNSPKLTSMEARSCSGSIDRGQARDIDHGLPRLSMRSKVYVFRGLRSEVPGHAEQTMRAAPPICPVDTDGETLSRPLDRSRTTPLSTRDDTQCVCSGLRGTRRNGRECHRIHRRAGSCSSAATRG